MESQGKVAVITGGSTGIGRATAYAPAERGMRVVLAARGAGSPSFMIAGTGAADRLPLVLAQASTATWERSRPG